LPMRHRLCTMEFLRSLHLCLQLFSQLDGSRPRQQRQEGVVVVSSLSLSLSLSLDRQQIVLFFSLPLPLLISAAIEPCITPIQRVHLKSGFRAALLQEQSLSLLSNNFEMELNGS
jgi:hypothetical protein